MPLPDRAVIRASTLSDMTKAWEWGEEEEWNHRYENYKLAFHCYPQGWFSMDIDGQLAGKAINIFKH